MYKFFALPVTLLLLASCGGPEKELDYDEIFDILTHEEGTIAGISIGDEWGNAKAQLKTMMGDVEVSDHNSQYVNVSIDYGTTKRRFYVDCTLEGGIISEITIDVQDKLENEHKIDALHRKLVDHFSLDYPLGFTRSEHDDPFDYDFGTWIIPTEEIVVNILDPYAVGQGSGGDPSIRTTLQVRSK